MTGLSTHAHMLHTHTHERTHARAHTRIHSYLRPMGLREKREKKKKVFKRERFSRTI